MDVQHSYTRQKRYFGMDLPKDKLTLLDTRDVLNDHPCIEQNIGKFEELKYISRGVQNIPDMSEHFFNSMSVQMNAHEVLNKAATEEPEQIARLRKKAEREQNYIAAVANQSKVTTPALQINNAQDCTIQYFQESQTLQAIPPSMHVQAVFKDPEIVKRPLNQVIFQPETNRVPQKFIAVYGKPFQQRDFHQITGDLQSTFNAYIFDVQNTSQPEFTLYSSVQINCIAFSQKDVHVLFAGLESGTVAMYDTRRSGYPVAQSDIQFSHKSPVTDLKIVKSKSASEFVSIGTDGQILFWDCRQLQKPMENEVYAVDFNQDKSLQFPLQSLNCEMKLLAGSSSGHIFNIDKKTKQIYAILGHSGAVRSIQRHQFHQRYFASCGDHSIKFYFDESSSKQPIMSFSSQQRYVDLRLSSSRPGVFVGARLDGYVDVFDLCRSAGGPVLQTQLFSASECTCMDFDQTGRFLAIGTMDGLVSLVQLGQGLVQNPSVAQDKAEKAAILQLFERETRRSKLLEARGKGKQNAHLEQAELVDLQMESKVEDEYRAMFE